MRPSRPTRRRSSRLRWATGSRNRRPSRLVDLPLDLCCLAQVGDSLLPEAFGQRAQHVVANVFEAQSARFSAGDQAQIDPEAATDRLADLAFFQRERRDAELARHPAAVPEPAHVPALFFAGRLGMGARSLLE